MNRLFTAIFIAKAFTINSCASKPGGHNRRNHTMLAVIIVMLTGGILMSCSNSEDEDREKSIDGYRTVVIGTQTWMAENLNYDSKNSTCYNNNKASCSKYGRLYTFEDAVKVCPPGWHLPKNNEWLTLISYVGGFEVAGEKLKATSEWDYDGNGTDDYNFNALPGGLEYEGGSFGHIGSMGIWWASSGNNERFEDHFALEYNGATATLEECGSPLNKHSVRCIKD